jgi:transcription initiation factor TFIID subunit TAF12
VATLAEIIAAMMRGELEAPATAQAQEGRGWTCAPVLSPQEQLQQQKDWEKEQKALAKKKKAEEEEAKIKAKEDLKSGEKKIKDNEKLLKQLKAELEEMDKLKDKEWDEMTEEDEAILEGEVELRARIAELEKNKAG